MFESLLAPMIAVTGQVDHRWKRFKLIVDYVITSRPDIEDSCSEPYL